MEKLHSIAVEMSRAIGDVAPEPPLYQPTPQYAPPSVNNMNMYPLVGFNSYVPLTFNNPSVDRLAGDPPVASSPNIESEDTKSRAQVFTENLINNQKEAVQWLQENYIYKDTTICRETFFKEYMRYCETKNMVPLSCSGFGKLVRGVFPKVKSRRLGARGQSKYHYYGIGYRGHLGTNGKGGSICDDFIDQVVVNTDIMQPGAMKIKQEAHPFVNQRLNELNSPMLYQTVSLVCYVVLHAVFYVYLYAYYI